LGGGLNKRKGGSRKKRNAEKKGPPRGCRNKWEIKKMLSRKAQKKRWGLKVGDFGFTEIREAAKIKTEGQQCMGPVPCLEAGKRTSQGEKKEI